MSIDETRHVLLDLAEALHAVHEHGIVHRDVRPANVLQEEGTGRVVLTDFGLAALLESGEVEVQRLTATGQLLGDMHFISPEQLRGERVTAQADVYQLGVLAHYLVTGDGPFGELSTERLILAHLEAEPRDLVAAGRGGAILRSRRWCCAVSPRIRPAVRRRRTWRAASRGLSPTPEGSPVSSSSADASPFSCCPRSVSHGRS
ncbi:MAG: hypothetical protein EXR95_01585 [Gemmatimonadetes bacterium]|nr:hypothetical protein [Gemmatimonadota bacterium]